MTVAAGYVCSEGVILCADTQETVPGFTKTDTTKLVQFSTQGVNLVFAGAGNNAVQIDETVWEVARRAEESSPSNATELNVCVRERLLELFPKHSYPRERVEVDVLMAGQWPNETCLFRIADCNVAPVATHACLGSGLILGSQLFQRHYDHKNSLSAASIVSIYVLHHVKRWVDGCGGKTDIAIVPKGGQIAFMSSDQVEKLEKYCTSYDDAVKDLLVNIPRTPASLGMFDAYVLQAKNKLALARLSFQDMEQSMREFAVHMGISYEDLMQSADESLAKIGITPSISQTLEDRPSPYAEGSQGTES